jgi:3-deoxy-D-manno-octulosonic-acid transferase
MLTNLEKQSIKKILLNARVSKRSYRKWKLLGKFSKNLFKKFDYTFPQNLESKRYLKKLEVKKVRFLGNLKFSQKKILNDKLDQKLIKLIRTKKVWCAASTHDGEENICLKVHNKLIRKYKNLMLIIIPRHIVRVNSILKDIYALNLKPHLHSNKGETDPKTNVYLVDTYGETELFFNLCKNVFIGKSLTAFGGQNPLEPARHNCSIIHGPNVSNFTEIYEFLDKKKISIKVKNESQLYSKIYKLIGRKNSVNIKDKINFIGLKILNKNLMEIKSLI